MPSVTFGADVVFRGRPVQATSTQPLTNLGQIIADRRNFGDVFHFTAAPITNQGTLSAVNRGTLRIANLAAPNSGIVSATAGSSVAFTGAFAQSNAGTVQIDIGGTAADQLGTVTVGAAATLAGQLNVQFANGYTPAAGNRFQVMTYALHSGEFSSINIAGLANDLIATPEYNATNLTLVISAAAPLMAQALFSSPPSSPAVDWSAYTSSGFEGWSADRSDVSLKLATRLSHVLERGVRNTG